MSEQDFQSTLLVALSAVGCLVWRQNVGQVCTRNRAGAVTGVFRAGPPAGACDIAGIAPGGIALQVEVKDVGDRTAKERRELQRRWGERVLALGGVHLKAVRRKGVSVYDDARAVAELVMVMVEARRGNADHGAGQVTQPDRRRR